MEHSAATLEAWTAGEPEPGASQSNEPDQTDSAAEEAINEQPSDSDFEDVQRAATRDSEAFGRLYQRYADRIYRHIAPRVSNPAIAEDLTAQTFLNAWQAIEKFRQIEGHSFISWLYSISNNLAVDHFRRSRREVEDGDAAERRPDDSDPEGEAIGLALRAEMQHLVKRLKPEQRLIVTLRVIDGLRYAEIGDLIGKSPGAVRVILFRALVALRREFKAREIKP